MNRITVETRIAAPASRVWEALTTPAAIEQWNAAHESWHTPRSEVDLREGGRFCHRMEARDGSAGFDMSGSFTAVAPGHRLEYRMDDGRMVEVLLAGSGGHTDVRESFDPESTNPPERQRQGWQAILDSLKQYVEGQPGT